MRRKNTFFYLISPIVIEWIFTYLVQLAMIILKPDLLENALIYTSIVSVVLIPIMAWIYKKDCERVPWGGGEPITKVTILAVSMLGITSCVAMNSLINITKLYEYSDKYQEVSSIIYDSSKAAQLIAVVVIAPVLEELVYRGLVYRRMREIGPVLPAVVISAFVFGINHGNLVQFVFATGIGILLALAYEEYKNISIPIVLHMAVNLTSLISTWAVH